MNANFIIIQYSTYSPQQTSPLVCLTLITYHTKPLNLSPIPIQLITIPSHPYLLPPLPPPDSPTPLGATVRQSPPSPRKARAR